MNELQTVNAALTVIQLLEASARLNALARAAIAAGKTEVTAEEMQAAVGDDDAALDALRAAIVKAVADASTG